MNSFRTLSSEFNSNLNVKCLCALLMSIHLCSRRMQSTHCTQPCECGLGDKSCLNNVSTSNCNFAIKFNTHFGRLLSHGESLGSAS